MCVCYEDIAESLSSPVPDPSAPSTSVGPARTGQIAGNTPLDQSPPTTSCDHARA